MASLGGAFAGSVAAAGFRTQSRKPSFRRRISCIGWDPEGILGAPQGGHIARMEFRRRLEKDAEAREEFSRQVRAEQEQRRTRREARVPPETNEGLVDYFLDTEARDIEFEIARLRPRLTKDFFEHIQIELAKLKFAVSRTKEMEDMLIELEAIQKVLLEGTEAYGRMEGDLVLAKERLMKILQSKDRKSTLLEMVERNELSRSVLSLLDENIADALKNDQHNIMMEIPWTWMMRKMIKRMKNPSPSYQRLRESHLQSLRDERSNRDFLSCFRVSLYVFSFCLIYLL